MKTRFLPYFVASDEKDVSGRLLQRTLFEGGDEPCCHDYHIPPNRP